MIFLQQEYYLFSLSMKINNIYKMKKVVFSKSHSVFPFWTKINVQKWLRPFNSPKKGVFFAYVDKSENRQIFWLHNFFFGNIYFINKGLGIIIFYYIYYQCCCKKVAKKLRKYIYVNCVTIQLAEKVVTTNIYLQQNI
jgi:hypothetical protein